MNRTLQGDKYEVYTRQFTKVSYGDECLKRLLEHITIEEAIKEGLLDLIPSKVKKYFDENPSAHKEYQEAVKAKYGFCQEKKLSAPFLATKKIKKEKEMQDFIDESKGRNNG